MAIIVRIEPEIPEDVGVQIMFHVGGIAALTTLLNATTAAPLLRALRFTRTEKMKKRMLAKLNHHLARSMKVQFAAHAEHPHDIRFQGADSNIVRQMVPLLSDESLEAPGDDGEADVSEDEHLS